MTDATMRRLEAAADARPSKVRAVLVDLDGTLFDNEHRVHLIRDPSTGMRLPDGEADWAAYSAACVDDTPVPGVVRLVQLLAERFLICVVSGRDVVAIDETKRQLAAIDINPYTITLREDKDRRPNGRFKVETARDLEDRLDIRFVLALDDYGLAAKALEEAGIPTVLVRENGLSVLEQI